MTGNVSLLQLTRRLLRKLQKNPALAQNVIIKNFDTGLIKIQEDPPIYVPSEIADSLKVLPDEERKKLIWDFQNQSEALIETAAEIDLPEDLKKEMEEGRSISLGRFAKALHFLAAGQAEGGEQPASLAVFGGKELGFFTEFGPVKFLRPEKVRKVKKILKKVKAESLEDRMNPETLRKAGITEPDNEKDFVALGEAFDRLLEFYSESVYKGYAVLQFLS